MKIRGLRRPRRLGAASQAAAGPALDDTTADRFRRPRKEHDMGLPYRARVDERWFLNLPGFHGGAYVVAYVEDTRERGLQHCGGCVDENCPECPYNFEPRMILEIADCNDRITLEFDVDSEAGRANSLHKLDTLLAALRVFREGVVAEFEPYDQRERELAEQRD